MREKEEICYGCYESSLGDTLIAISEKGVCAVLTDNHPATLLKDLRRRFPKASFRECDSKQNALIEKVLAAIDDPHKAIDFPLDMRGTELQQAVWKAILDIPPGQTRSYAEIARKANMPKAARAVATACRLNPLSGIIPCHRVIKSDGTVAGSATCAERRRKMLKQEQ